VDMMTVCPREDAAAAGWFAVAALPAAPASPPRLSTAPGVILRVVHRRSDPGGCGFRLAGDDSRYLSTLADAYYDCGEVPTYL
jgi:hypothetical protein